MKMERWTLRYLWTPSGISLPRLRTLSSDSSGSFLWSATQLYGGGTGILSGKIRCCHPVLKAASGHGDTDLSMLSKPTLRKLIWKPQPNIILGRHMSSKTLIMQNLGIIHQHGNCKKTIRLTMISYRQPRSCYQAFSCHMPACLLNEWRFSG